MTNKQMFEMAVKKIEAPKAKKTGEPILTASLADCIKAKKEGSKKG